MIVRLKPDTTSAAPMMVRLKPDTPLDHVDARQHAQRQQGGRACGEELTTAPRGLPRRRQGFRSVQYVIHVMLRRMIPGQAESLRAEAPPSTANCERVRPDTR